MIKIKKIGKRSYFLDCPPNWYMALTKSEVVAIWKLLNKWFKKNKNL